MKKYLIALTLFIAVAVAFADVWVYQSDGTRYSHNYSTFDSLSRVAPGTLALSQTERIVPFEGETFNLDIYANQSWTASVSDASRVQLSKTHGDGKDVISVTVAANKQDEQVYDTVTVKLADGTQNAIHLTENAWQDDLTVNPLSKKISLAGGTFKVGIESNTSWAVDNSVDWVSLDKTSGTLNDSITVTVSPSDTYKTTQSILTVTTPNKTILHSIVTRIGDELSVIPSSKTFSPLGGSFKMYVSSNTSWTVSVSEPWVTFDKTSGCFNDSIGIYVDESNDANATTAIITVRSDAGKIVKCMVNREMEQLSVSDSVIILGGRGCSFNITVNSNNNWSAFSDKSWAVLSNTAGVGNGKLTIYVEENTEHFRDTALITFSARNGTQNMSVVSRAAREKCKASDYAQVTIGTQTWMAENYRCSKYDTESEAYNASWLKENTVPTSKKKEVTYTPNYTDATDKAQWDDGSAIDAGNLNSEQIAKLGYLYNWAAAVGVEDGLDIEEDFVGKRQGICPNGWHVPTTAEWQTMYDYIYNAKGLSSKTVGECLKTTSGWNYYCENGTDSYGFAALPSGRASESSIGSVGSGTYFWTTTLSDSDDYIRYLVCTWYLGCSNDRLGGYDGYYHYRGQSVRCLRD